MNRLKEQDAYFDFRMHYDDQDQVDAVLWQTGPMRAALQLYGHVGSCVDARKSEVMNAIRMRYISFVVADANKQIAPASESFVFEEEKALYGFVIMGTVEMTPGFKLEWILLMFANSFLEPSDAKKWMPNVILLVDEYHFISGKNKTNVLVTNFGPRAWNLVKDNFMKAFRAFTEEKCLVSIHSYNTTISCFQLSPCLTNA